MSDGQGWDVDGLTVALAEAEAVIEGLTYENERLRAAVRAVRNLHRESFPDPEGRTGCTACAVTWPCATIRHLDAALGGEQM